MVHSIDFKSALIGGFIVVMVVILAGAVPFMAPVEYGRFEIETNDSHAFILDSATGQVWSSKFYISSSVVSVGHDPNFYAPKTYDEVDP